MRRSIPCFLALLFTLSANAFAATTPLSITPTTTLQAETANNTSAPGTISASTNGIAASGNISKLPFRDLIYTNANTKVYTTLLGWFGESGHIPVGYNSQDPLQVGNQIADMVSRGIDGTFLAWYGADAYEDTTAKALKQQSELQPGFNFAIMIDHGTITWDSRGLSATAALIYHMNYVAQNYYLSPAYLHLNGRPVVMEFGMELENIDWPTVRASIQGNPLVIFRNANGFIRPTSDGAYAWGPADTLGYLSDFYWNSLQYPTETTFGGSAKGFNDSLASWTQNRYVSEQCGQTWLNSVKDASNYYSGTKQLPFMMIATWNDYEEGTTIESGIDSCLSLSASATTQTLVWSLAGNGQENTIDHYTVFLSSDGQNLMKLTDLPVGSRSLDLSSYTFTPGIYTLYVKAASKSSLKNQMSNAATFTIASQPGTAPQAALSLTSLNFGSQQLGTSSSAQTVTLANSGGSSMSISGISATGDFLESNNCGSSLGAGASCTILVSFTPSQTGARPGTLRVADSASGSPHTVLLTGTGAASQPCAAPSSPGVVVCAPLNGATVTSPVTFVAKATPASGQTISAMYVYVDDVTVYKALSTNSVNINVTIATGSHIIRTQVWDTSGALYKAGSSIAVTKNTAPSVTLTPGTLAFSSRNVGTTSAAQSVTLTNSGGGALTISSIAANGDFAQTNSCGSTLNAGASCNIAVTFRPTQTGPRTGALTITDSASGSPHMVSLTGTGKKRY